jgi:hypothetical protein
MERVAEKINSAKDSRLTRPFFLRKEQSKALFFQPKLTIGPTDDVYEREADAVADKVMSMSDQEQIQSKISPLNIQRKCAACEEEEHAQRKEDGASRQRSEAPSIVSDAINAGGAPLDEGTKSFMENRFGYDFGNVKIHTDTIAAKSAQSINALAYTNGNSIVFNHGQYSPETENGKRLLAHELTHVVQQKGVQRRIIQRQIIDRNVTTNEAMLTQLGLTRQQIIDTIISADADAIVLAQNAEDTLTTELNNAQSGNPVDANAETILVEELGLSFNNRAHHGLIRQQIGRFRRVRETLESGYLRYIALGIGNISLVGCQAGDCGENFAFSCPGNRLIVLCQTFWDTPDEQSATILHEPFHIWFSMLRHADNALRRADSSCFESFALRVSGRTAPATCVAHTAG